jgi:hypothetical protein
MAITLEQAKNLRYGQVLHLRGHANRDGSPMRWRVNGRPKVWKRRPDEVRVPIKYGLKTCGYLTHHTLDQFTLAETCCGTCYRELCYDPPLEFAPRLTVGYCDTPGCPRQGMRSGE